MDDTISDANFRLQPDAASSISQLSSSLIFKQHLNEFRKKFDTENDTPTTQVTQQSHEKYEKETSQLWIQRQIQKYFSEDDVNDETIPNFIQQQDITAFRNFMTSNPTLRQALFILIKRSSSTINIEPLKHSIPSLLSPKTLPDGQKNRKNIKRSSTSINEKLSPKNLSNNTSTNEDNDNQSNKRTKKLKKKIKTKKSKTKKKKSSSTVMEDGNTTIEDSVHEVTDVDGGGSSGGGRSHGIGASSGDHDNDDDSVSDKQIRRRSNEILDYNSETEPERNDFPKKMSFLHKDSDEECHNKSNENQPIIEKLNAIETVMRPTSESDMDDVSRVMKKMKKKKKRSKSVKTKSKNKKGGLKTKAIKSDDENNKESLSTMGPIQQQQQTAVIPTIMAIEKTEIVFSWNDEQKIPEESNEFIYIVTKSDKMDADKENEFDNLYLVGYCPNKMEFMYGIELVKTIIGDNISFQCQMQLLNNFFSSNGTTPMLKWQDEQLHFENFISNTIMRGIKQLTKQQTVIEKKITTPTTDITTPKEVITTNNTVASMDISAEDSSVDFIENLLRPRIYAYIQNPDKSAKLQLLLELSIYEMKIIDTQPFYADTIYSIQRMLTIFSVMHMLYLQTNRDWIRKAIFHSIELTSRVLALNVQQRLWNLLGDDCLTSSHRRFSQLSDADHRKICLGVRPLLLQFIQLAAECMQHNSDEFLCLSRIKQCLKILDYIEEEFDKLVIVVKNVRDPKHDMTFDRTKLDEAASIFQQIWNVFEECFFESSLESGNFEAMKNIYLQLSKFLIDLNNIIPS